jgi:hypothetical protein
MESKVGRTIKVVPARHFCKLNAGIVMAGKVRVCNEAITSLYFNKDVMD